VGAIIDAIVESNLPESEKAERLGFIVDQAQMRSEVQGAIDSLVTDRQATEELMALDDAELLADPSLFAQPQLNVDVQFDPEGRTQVALLEEVEGILEQSFGGTIPPEIVSAFTNEAGEGIIDLVAQGVLDPESDQFAQLLSQAAPGVDPALMRSALVQGLETARIRHEAFDTALDQNQYQAGSIQLIYALFQAALGAGLDVQTAGQVAEDRNIHHVIDVYSGGKVGMTGTGGRAGLGMLTPEAYKRLGFDPESTIGDPVAELEAIILYMMEAGNPAVRLQTFFESGVWGN
jgi:hypothetical protein